MIDQSPIIVEQSLPVSRARVWKAITDGEEMPKWFFEQIKTFRPEMGFKTSFTVENEGRRRYVFLWEVTDAVPERRISYLWNYEGLSGHGSVDWELTEEDGGTKLTLTNHGLHTFPQDDPSFSRESCEGGWRYFLKERLPAYLSDNAS